MTDANSTLPHEDEIPLQIQNMPAIQNHPSDSQILTAAQSNDRQNFERLMAENQIDLRQIRNQKGFTVLHFAAYNNSIEFVKIVLNAQSDVSYINQQTQDGFTAIHFAAFRGNLQILELLVQHGGDHTLMTHQRMNIMHIGAQGDQPISIAFAAQHGISIHSLDMKGGTPLHWACFYGSDRASLFLLALIDKNAPYRPMNQLDEQGLAPLHLAVMSGNTKLVKKLIIYGADKSLTSNKGKTAAMIAKDNDYKNIYSMITRRRNCLVAYYNIKQGIKRMRRSPIELLRFISIMSIAILIYYNYIEILIYDYVAFGLLLCSFLAVSFSDPGYQQYRNESLIDLLKTFEDKDVCPQCNLIKVARTRHCDICQRCVLVYDHHCPWINNCVGAGNHVLFMLFIFILDIVLIYCIVRFAFNATRETQFEFTDNISSQIVQYTVFYGICAIFFIGVTLLIITQLINILNGITTFERFAIKTQSSTFRASVSQKTSLMEDDQIDEPQPKRYQIRTKNLWKFFTNKAAYRNKEQAIQI